MLGLAVLGQWLYSVILEDLPSFKSCYFIFKHSCTVTLPGFKNQLSQIDFKPGKKVNMTFSEKCDPVAGHLRISLPQSPSEVTKLLSPLRLCSNFLEILADDGVGVVLPASLLIRMGLISP